MGLPVSDRQDFGEACPTEMSVMKSQGVYTVKQTQQTGQSGILVIIGMLTVTSEVGCEDR